MGVNKVDLSTGETLIDISNDTVTPETLAEGATAHDAKGEPIIGTMKSEGGTGGSSGIIDVPELPQNNINENAVYRLTESVQTNITEVYIVAYGQPTATVQQFVASMGVPTIPNIYVVDELTSDLKPSDVQTFSEINLYILRSDGFCYLNVPAFGGFITMGLLGFQATGYDKGFTDNVYAETELGVYTTLETYKEVIRYFIRKNGEWEEISAIMSRILPNGLNDVDVLSGEYQSEEVAVKSNIIDIKSFIKNDRAIPSKVKADVPLAGDLATYTNFDERIKHITPEYFYKSDGEVGNNIREYAFAYYTSLESVNIAEGVYTIGSHAFTNCSNLKSVTLPQSLLSINGGAFNSCTSLERMVIPANVDYIGGYIFDSCILLHTVVFEGTPQELANSAFSGSYVKTIFVPWAEHEVAGAPWGAYDATIVYGSNSGAGYTNIVPTTINEMGAIYNGTGYKEGYGLIDAEEQEDSSSIITGYFPVTKTDVIRVSGGVELEEDFSFIAFYDENFELIGIEDTSFDIAFIENNVFTLAISASSIAPQFNQHEKIYARCSMCAANGEISGADLIVTLNEVIA